MEAWHATTLLEILPFPTFGGILTVALWLLLLGLLERGLVTALHWLRRLDLPPHILGWDAAGCGGVLLATLAGLGALLLGTTPEDYRERAWRELQAERHPLVVLAERADQVGAGSMVVAVQASVHATQERLRSALAGYDFGIPALEALKATVLERIKPALEPSPPIAERHHRTLVQLQLGLAQAALYQSDRILDRALRLRQDQIASLQTAVVVLGGVGFLLLLARVQAQASSTC